ncbi:MAG: hypothetical protein K6T31_09600, partial [Alicyclobacillus sp.]|nr:hypothetical protein [Alicyclobacillus sp.]
MRQLCDGLTQAGAPADETALACANGWMPLVEFAQNWLKQTDDQRAQQAVTAAARDAALARCEEAERRARAAAAALQRTDEAWQAVRATYSHLPAELSLAVALLDRIAKLQEEVTQWRLREQQLRVQQQRVADYAAQVSALARRLGELAPEGEDVARRVRLWRARLAEARQQHGRQQEISVAIEETEKVLGETRKQLHTCAERLERARLSAGCDSWMALRAAALQAKALIERQEEQQRLRQQMESTGDGMPVHVLLQEVRCAPDAAQLEEMMARQRDELTKVEEALLDVQRRLGELQEQRRQVEAHTLDGPTAAQQAEYAFARVDVAWNEWLRLYLARQLLQRAIQEFRDRTEARVLTEAGKALATLTNGRYTAVEVDQEDTRAYLVAVAAGGARRRPEELSDGTRDQLFLALRLAFLARHLADMDPLPVVMDDVF